MLAEKHFVVECNCFFIFGMVNDIETYSAYRLVIVYGFGYVIQRWVIISYLISEGRVEMS